jgi:hypothetical protein
VSGSSIEWRDVPDMPGLQVSRCGQARRSEFLEGRPVQGTLVYKLKLLRHGYLGVNYKQKWFKMHRVVYRTFIGPLQPGLVVCHLDGNPANNASANLAQLTQRENMSHRAAHGTFYYGERHPSATLSNQQVRELKEDIKRIKRSKSGRVWPGALKELSAKHSINYEIVANLTKATGRTWRHV